MKKRLGVVCEDPSLLPVYASPGAAGADLRSSSREEIVLEPGCSALIPTGLRFEIPEGYEIQLRPRSGLALKSQITLLNTPATIDSDYRGEIKVILINHGKQPFVVTYGMRIAQMLLCPVIQADFELVENLTTTVRGTSGFGHTGIN